MLAAILHVADCEGCRRFVGEIVAIARLLRSTELVHAEQRGSPAGVMRS